MDNSNKKRAEVLGEPHGTANNKLRKSIIFWLVKETRRDICHRCGERIEKIEELSIEHIENWMSAENPSDSFYDLNNISFSHLKCNISVSHEFSSRPNSEFGETKERYIYIRKDRNFLKKYRIMIPINKGKSTKTLGYASTLEEAIKIRDTYFERNGALV